MDWKKIDKIMDDKVLDALARAINAENGVDELFKRVVTLELAAKVKATKPTVAKDSESN